MEDGVRLAFSALVGLTSAEKSGLTETFTGVGCVVKTGTWHSSKDRESGMRMPLPMHTKRSRSLTVHLGRSVGKTYIYIYIVRERDTQGKEVKQVEALLELASRRNLHSIYPMTWHCHCQKRTFGPYRQQQSLNFSNRLCWHTLHSNGKSIFVGKNESQGNLGRIVCMRRSLISRLGSYGIVVIVVCVAVVCM